jgi:subtilisin family serine protease
VIGRPTTRRGPGVGRPGAPPPAPTTGRSVVVFADPDEDGAATLRRLAGLSDVADSRDAEPGDADARALRQADAVVFPGLGLAVAAVDPQRLAGDGAVLAVTPELVHHVLPEVPEGYLAGYRDAVTDLTGRLLDLPGDTAEPTAPPFADTPQYTWGLQATEVPTSPRTGRGIRVAVLDTGVDLTHPDLAGRSVTATSFVAGQSPQDGHGHGTHCVGTACGPRTPQGTRGYGVASDTEVFVGKVLSDEGSGTDAEILAGIAWAVRNGCQVISMSLGADVVEPSPAYAAAGRRALDQGSLIVAAAGNNADRENGDVGFVGVPANSPEILAVGALDPFLAVAWFSARSGAVPGGQVDLAAPGVDVYSSWPLPDCYDTISGTSMATPHVAGLAALWAEETGLRGRELWQTLTGAARRLTAPSVDVGSGLPLAPR